MPNRLKKIYTECSICHMQRKESNLDWYYPTPEQRRQDYEKGILLSHGFCNKCYELWERKELSDLEKTK